MMKKIALRLLLAIIVVLQLSGCKSQMIMSNGGYSDISLVRESKDYSIKRLEEINTESNAVFGIPFDKSVSKKQGFVFRFNGINLNATGGALPIISMIGLSLTTGFILNGIVGYRKDVTTRTSGGILYNEESYDKYKLGLGFSGRIIPVMIGSILTIPISGAINNQIWSGAAYSRAAFNANSKLLMDNPDTDVFLNPKYELEKRQGLWSQKAKIRMKVMGATIKEDK
jgi:hypothetical protein